MTQKNGFTLVEIMIVVAIIGMLAALIIPNLLHARINANESVARGTLKVIAAACENFRAVQVPPVYPINLAALTSSNPQYIDETIDTATTGLSKKGYNFTYTLINNQQYVCCATPSIHGGTGVMTFCVNETGILRAADNGGAIITAEAEYEALAVCQ